MLGHIERMRRPAADATEAEMSERERVQRQQQLVWYVLAIVGAVEIWLAGSLLHLWR